MRWHTLDHSVGVPCLGLCAYPVFDFVPLDKSAGHDSGRLHASHCAPIKLPVFGGLQIFNTQPHLVQLILKCIQGVVLFLGHPIGVVEPCGGGVSREKGAVTLLSNNARSKQDTKMRRH